MRFPILFFLLSSSIIFAQNDAITSLSSVVFEDEILLNQKNKHTFSQSFNISASEDIWSQFERVDAVFISFWTGSGEEGEKQYKLDLKKVRENYQAPSIIYFAQEDPQLFSYPQKQTGYGTEIAFFEKDADSLCLAKYLRKKIAPKGVWPYLIYREFGTTAVNFKYRFSIPKQSYNIENIPSFKVILRTSAKSDTVRLNSKIVMTVQGKRKNSASNMMDKFLYEAILNGMKAEAFPINHAKWIIENPEVFFVENCRICENVKKGIQNYIENYVNKTTSTASELLDDLVLKDKTEKQTAFLKIVNYYVDQHFNTTQLSKDEVDRLKSQLSVERKKGMSKKKSDFGNFCPSCDGACKVK